MPFILCLVVSFGVFFAGQKMFRRLQPNPFLDSLRLGKSHYLLLGVVVGIFFPETEPIFRPFEALRYNFLGAILLWFGLQTGLSTDFQILRTVGFPALTSQAVIIIPTAIFTILAVLASGSILYRHLGLVENLPLAILLLTAFAITVRIPEPIVRWPNRAMPAHAQIQNHPIGNITALVLFTIAFPFVAQDPIFYFLDLPIIGTMGYTLFMIGLSIVGGIALDFTFRSQISGVKALSLAFGVAITLFGLCQTPGLPALSVGFLAGVWLVNTTVAKREVIESAARANDIIEPIFYVLLGTIIGGFGGAPFFHFAPLFPLAIILILVRGMGRTIGLTISQATWQMPETWRELLALSWHPQGTIGVAVGVQALYLLQFEHHTLIAGLALAVLLGQVILIPSPTPPTSPNRD